MLFKLSKILVRQNKILIYKRIVIKDKNSCGFMCWGYESCDSISLCRRESKSDYYAFCNKANYNLLSCKKFIFRYILSNIECY